MRPQQNRRMRGRGSGSGSNNNGNQNRKGPNPLTRSYESNGPDVKIRGSAQQIAEKYTTLARDAQSAGDRVMAENYLQHAEHYNRIIMAALAQMPQQQQVRDTRDEDDLDEDGDETFAPSGAQPGPAAQQQPVEQPAPRQEHQPRRERQRDHNREDGTGPQPVIDGVPAEVALKQEAEPQAASAEEQVAAVGEGDAEAAAPRKPRRPRRPRVKAGEEAAAGETQPLAEEPVTEAAQ